MTTALLLLAVVFLVWVIRRGTFRRRDTVIDDLILARGVKYTFTGHDEDMEVRARTRRERADRIRREANAIDTRDDVRKFPRRA